MNDKQFNIEKKKYVKEVNSYLICDFGTRNKFIRDLKNDMEEYIESSSATDFKEVAEHFGDPKDIVKGFLETADTKKIKRKMNVTRVILIGVIIALVMWGLGITAVIIDNHKSNTGYGVIEMSDAAIQPISFTNLGDIL